MISDRVTILGIPFDRLTLEEAITRLLQILAENLRQPFFVATPNPEMLLETLKNPEFKDVLQKTDLNIPDGAGIIFAAKVNGTPLKERVTGTDLMQHLCAKITPKTKVFLLGAADGVAERTKDKLLSHKKINIVGTYSGSPDASNDQKLREIVNAAAPELLFVAYGAPKQELWLARNLPHLKSVKVAIGVGGAFDFISGIRKRAPLIFQKLALEWLYRLIQEPHRIKRIFNAVVIFPLLFLLAKFKK